MLDLKKTLLLTTMLMLSMFAHSQDSDSAIINKKKEVDRDRNAISAFNMFRDPSYILFGSGLGNLEPLIFEGNIVPHFMISISDNARWGIELSPRIMFRMYDKPSFPIRTPSFMPKVTIFWQFLHKKNQVRNLFIYMAVMHHSNGQDGEFYESDSTTINTLSGNFSTNWVEAGFFLSRPNENLLFNTNYIKLYATYNYKQEKKLKGTYGRVRLYANLKNTVKLSDAFKIIVAPDNKNKKYVFNQSINVGWIAGKLNENNALNIKRLILNYTLSFTPTFLKDMNIFIQYYYGQDYYNIYFDRQLNIIRIGISSSTSVLF